MDEIRIKDTFQNFDGTFNFTDLVLQVFEIIITFKVTIKLLISLQQ